MKEGGEYKPKKRTVVVLCGENDLVLSINRVDIVVMVEEDVVEIFLGHYPCEEYEEHESANYSNDLLS